MILMDIMMPDMDGIETTRRLKTMPQFEKVPVIMVTGKSEGAAVRDSIKAGTVNFIVKPLDVSPYWSGFNRWMQHTRNCVCRRSAQGRVLAVEDGTAVLQINGQTVRRPGLNARPRENVRLRVDTEIA
jgi:PleD family two-component response regulator